MAEMIDIAFPDGQVRQYEKGITAMEIAQSISEGLARNVLSAKVNGEVWDATRPIETNARLQLLTCNDPEGKATFCHSSAHLMAEALEALYPGFRACTFGHAGDGNLHYNLSPAADRCGAEHQAAFLALEGPINTLVHDAVVAHQGSISAEHGLGVLRRDESARYKSPVELKLMRAIKSALDPLNLMNPGKLLP